jgi:hypothetical protein
MPEAIAVSFTKKKETKNAVQFEEDVAEGRSRGVVGSIYVLKDDLAAIGNPQHLNVHIESAD